MTRTSEQAAHNKLFVKEEKVTAKSSGWAAMRRLATSLPLLLWLLPLALTLNFLASSSPSFFRWYAGRLTHAEIPADLPVIGLLRFTLEGLLFIALISTLLRIISWAVFELAALWSVQRIYHRMIRAVSRTRTSYFDENPSGRMINRLVGDFNQVRSSGVTSIADTTGAFIDLLSILVLTSFSNYYVSILMFPMLMMFFYLQAQRSPVLGHARSLTARWTGKVLDRKTDLIGGRSTYLLYGQFAQLLNRLGSSFGSYMRAAVLNIAAETWFSLWVRLMSELYVVIVMVTLVWGMSMGKIDAALAGVIISALFALNGSLNFLDFTTTQMARQLAHTQRVFEYIDLPTEESDEHVSLTSAEAIEPDATAGELQFRHYTMSYRIDSPIILDDFCLTIPAGKKVAIIGRTGCGKTSVIQALLRLVHVHDGTILYGKQSLHALPVFDARRLFGVVPQFPYLFAGTVRSNLDRLNVIQDKLMLDSLEAVGLRLSLDHVITEHGENISLGERQLLCLARTIASKRSIIILDEPTSGLDPETDARIQSLFDTVFNNKTVLTVAHRRESLWRYDWVVEMDSGRIVHQGPPSEILS